MEVVDILIVHGTLVPMVSQEVVPGGALAIHAGKIVDIDTSRNIVERYSAHTFLMRTPNSFCLALLTAIPTLA